MAPTSKAFVTVLLLSLALCQITAAEPDLKNDGLREKIVKGIKDIRTASDHLRKETETINKHNAIFRGSIIHRGFDGIGKEVTEVTKVISSAHTSLNETDAKIVVEKLTKFVEGHWKPLIHVVQVKHGIRELSKFFEPIRGSLRKLESEFKSFENALLKVTPKLKKLDVKKQFDTIIKLIEETIKIYERPPPNPHGDSLVEAIQEALTTFLQAQQELLNVLIGKDGITTYAGDLA